MNKKCIICGEVFSSPPSAKKVTCSKQCQREYARWRMKGKHRSEETKKRISAGAKGRDMENLQKVATEAAKRSPKSGRFMTNINAIDWHLVSPEGVHYEFHSLNYWAREHCELFGFETNEKNAMRIAAGIRQAKKAMLGKISHGQRPCATYKGWRVICK